MTRLQPGMFQDARALKVLTLSENKIEEIDSKSFTGMANLTHLDLLHNKLTSITLWNVFLV